MSDDESDDDLPLFSNVRQNESILGREDTILQTSRYTVVATKLAVEDDRLPTGSGSPSPFNRKPLKTTGDFILMLDKLKVPGPLAITEALDSKHQIGEGGQFIVYWNEMLGDPDQTWLDKVAVKKCKFDTIDENQTLDLSSQSYRGQVHDMQLEIAALQDARLKDHPNIVSLLGYGVDMRTWHETPFLVMPLAIGDFTKLLRDQLSPGILHQLLLGIGYGLDAIHDCRIIHGDLKPENVLIFDTYYEPIPLVAKLADFGLSLDEVSTANGGSVLISGYSAGWAAPEVTTAYHQKSLIPTDVLLSSDRFSYGLLVLSSLCFLGKIPPPASYQSIESLRETISQVPHSMSAILEIVLPQLLLRPAESRPVRVGKLLEDKSAPCIAWAEERDGFEAWQAEQQKQVSMSYHHPWELPNLGPILVLGLARAYETYGNMLSGPQLFAMFLLRSVQGITDPDKALQINILLAAARKDFPPAQGVAQRVLESYDMRISDHLTESEISTWLAGALVCGFPTTISGTGKLSAQEVEAAQSTFRSKGGYNQFYSPISRPPKAITEHEVKRVNARKNDQVDKYENKLIHQLATYGETERLEVLLETNTTGINDRNTLGETALYKACLSGHWEVVLLLCQKGADASMMATGRKITCLHWLFNFPASHTEQLICALIQAGADPNASLEGRGSLVNYHFPFRWPSGTPLHWAVTVSNHDAVTTLLNHGADPLIRNGQDPYKADDNVRFLGSHGTAEQGEYSETPENCLGVNPIDLAVANHDWQVLEAISSNIPDKNIDLFAVDEEGYSPFHRLSLNRVQNTVTGLRFWYPAFMGGRLTRLHNITRTVQALKSIRGNIDQLTYSPTDYGLGGAEGGLSPLMIAVTKSDHEVVEVLCNEGADVNLQNRCGRTPLTMMNDLNVAGSSPPNSISSIVRSLVSRGADIHHRTPDNVTPLLCATSSNDLMAVKLLLEHSSDMLTSTTDGVVATAHLIIGMRHIKNLDHSFMSVAESEQREVDLAALLESYVVPAARCNPFLVGNDENGKSQQQQQEKRKMTLLHCCASAAMFKCAKVLVEAGAAANPIADLGGTPNFIGGYTVRDGSEVYGTPLDVVLQTEKVFETSRSERLSQQKVDFVFDKLKEIRKLLIKHGGKLQAELETQGNQRSDISSS